ncbi:MAG: VOC family protein, partial [Euryarchaeota archaeon]
MSGCQRQCDWDENDVCRTCGIDYSPPKPPESTEEVEDAELLESGKKLRPFHLAFPVDDLPAAKKFYTEVLGCSTGREKE